MKKIDIVRLLLCVTLVFATIIVPVFADDNVPDISVTQGCNTINAATPLLGSGQLVDNCTAAVLFETNSDTLLYAWNADAQMYPASLVKIMTCLIALEKGNEQLTID